MNVIPDFILWLYEQLSTNVDLLALITSPQGKVHVYENQSSEKRASGLVPAWNAANPDYPAVRFEIVDCPHTTGNGGRRFASSPQVLIEGLDKGESAVSLGTIAGIIDDLFGARATGQKNDLAIQGSICLGDYVDTENSENGVIKHLGGTYEFFVFKHVV